MAKYRQVQAGSSFQIHLSLWKGEEKAFQRNLQEGSIVCSEVFRWFLGGWIAHMPEMMVFNSSNINTFNRNKFQFWAPKRLAWCYDNRTVGSRVVDHGPSLRNECCIPGADCNSYLAHSAAIDSGLDGIRRRIEPPPMFVGDAYGADNLMKVSASLEAETGIVPDQKIFQFGLWR